MKHLGYLLFFLVGGGKIHAADKCVITGLKEKIDLIKNNLEEIKAKTQISSDIKTELSTYKKRLEESEKGYEKSLECYNQIVRACGKDSWAASNAKVVLDTTKENLETYRQFYSFVCETMVDPIGYLNNIIYKPYKCKCDNWEELKSNINDNIATKCKIDKDTGIHYKQVGSLNSNKYIFFFHGMTYSLERFAYYYTTSTEYGKEVKLSNFDVGPLKDCGYNIVVVEYNSFNESGTEKVFGLENVKKMSDKLYTFTNNFLTGKNPEKVILSGHSHGNTYCFELLERFIDNDKYMDKLVYLGCKGYLRLERVLETAINGLRGDEEYSKLVNGAILLLNGDTIIDKIRNLVRPKNYYIIEENNDNEKKIQKFIKHLEITNHKLKDCKHEMTYDNFEEMFDAYNKYISHDKNKIPCLLFYSNTDEYVGAEFKNKIEELTEEAKENKGKEEKKKKEENAIKDAVIQKEYKDTFEKHKTELGLEGVKYEDLAKISDKPQVANESISKKINKIKKVEDKKTTTKKGCCKGKGGNSCKSKT